MRYLCSILSAIFLLASCGPSRHAIHVEMRHPSKSGLDLSGKLLSVIYVSGEDGDANLIAENIATGFASALEKDYGSVNVFSVEGTRGEYAKKDSLVNLLINSGADMTFLLDYPELGVKMSSGLPIKVNLYCFDGMDSDETMHSFSGHKLLQASNEGMLSDASKTGMTLAESFAPEWRHEQYSIAYYDTSQWYDALLKAEAYDWKGAMDIWFELLDKNDLMKKAAAEYNIAVACYMLGDIELAAEWLDRSDEDNKMPTLSDGLRSRINSFLQGRR